MNQLWQQPTVRDFFGNWAPPAIRNLNLLNDPGCFRPAWYSAPKFRERVLPELGYRQSQLAMPVGGYLYAVTVRSDSGDAFQVLITDLSLNRKLFNAPIESKVLDGDPYFFPDLYPITGNGNFKVELWNLAGNGPITAEVVLHIVEPKGV